MQGGLSYFIRLYQGKTLVHVVCAVYQGTTLVVPMRRQEIRLPQMPAKPASAKAGKGLACCGRSKQGC
jgi:hypothetical protein